MTLSSVSLSLTKVVLASTVGNAPNGGRLTSTAQWTILICSQSANKQVRARTVQRRMMFIVKAALQGTIELYDATFKT